MKNLVLLLSLFIPSLLLNQQETDAIPGDYIEIDYIGQHLFKSLVIYKEKSELEIVQQGLTKRFDSLKQIIPVRRALTKEEKMQEVKSRFDFVMTNKKTYKKIINYIQIRDHLFTSGIGYEGYKIIVNGKIYCITYNLKGEFFEELTKYLTIQNCDKHVIERIIVISKGT